VTHDLRMVEYTDQVFEILDGKLSAEGTGAGKGKSH
jgi:ABC-type lipoprotein export system ATPase subunit